MSINRNNYEAWFIDYHEGNLGAGKVAELLLFVEQNPDLRAEFEAFQMYRVEPGDAVFPDRDLLKKDAVGTDNLKDYMVAALEGDLDPDSKAAFAEVLKENEALRREYGLFEQTISQPDLSEIYPHKSDLKRQQPFFRVYRKQINWAVAAMLFLGLVAGALLKFNRSAESVGEHVAVNQPLPSQAASAQVDGIPGQSAGTTENTEKTQPEDATGAAAEFQPKRNAGNSTHKTVGVPVQPGVNEIRESLNQLAVLVPLEPGLIQSASLPQDLALRNYEAFKAAAPAGEHYLTLWEAIRKTGRKNLRRLAENSDEMAFVEAAPDEKNIGPDLVGIVGKGLGKISNDKVKLEPIMADAASGKRRFSFSVGRFSIER